LKILFSLKLLQSRHGQQPGAATFWRVAIAAHFAGCKIDSAPQYRLFAPASKALDLC